MGIEISKYDKENSNSSEIVIIERILELFEIKDDDYEIIKATIATFPEEYIRSFAVILELILNDSTALIKTDIKNIFLLFLERISFEEQYFHESNKENEEPRIKLRRHETHPFTKKERTQLEHLLGTVKLTFLSFNKYIEDGTNNKTIESLTLAKTIFGEKQIQLVLLLSAFFHDFIEDAKDQDKAISDIKGFLKEYGFENLEKFITPITKILTHKKSDSVETYLKSIENPNDEVFKNYTLNDNERKSLAALSLHIKIMGDIAQNWKSTQTEFALIEKVPLYIPFVLEAYPDFMEFMDVANRLNPEIKKIFNIIEKNYTELTTQNIKKIVQKLLNEKNTEFNS